MRKKRNKESQGKKQQQQQQPEIHPGIFPSLYSSSSLGKLGRGVRRMPGGKDGNKASLLPAGIWVRGTHFKSMQTENMAGKRAEVRILERLDPQVGH